MLAMTGLALAIRLYLLTRLRYLTGITEYDDGVYLGGAVSLISGIVPYHGFAFVQPPGILLLMAPAALLAKVLAARVRDGGGAAAHRPRLQRVRGTGRGTGPAPGHLGDAGDLRDARGLP